jgi:hypothetical protein
LVEIDDHAFLVSFLVGIARYLGVADNRLPPLGQLEGVIAVDAGVRSP